jgi:hypothetical protein
MVFGIDDVIFAKSVNGINHRVVPIVSISRSYAFVTFPPRRRTIVLLAVFEVFMKHLAMLFAKDFIYLPLKEKTIDF